MQSFSVKFARAWTSAALASLAWAFPVRLAASDEDAAATSAASGRVVVLVPVPKEPAWQDDAFLAAVAAVQHVAGKPLALAVDPADPWRPELLDFLRRYEPERVWWLGEHAPPESPRAVATSVLVCDSADSAARALAAEFWSKAGLVVLFEPADRSAALAASVLAARLDLPLFPCAGGVLSEATRSALGALGAARALVVGGEAKGRLEGLSITRLADAEAVTRWLAQHGRAVDYLAVANPRDVTLGPAPKLSLAAVVLAVGRGGALAPLAFDARWKEPRSVAGEASKRFRVERDPADGRWGLQVDRDADGAFAGDGEARVHTGETLALDGRDWSVDLDVIEKGDVQTFWLTSPTPAEMRAELARYRRAAGREPRFVCLVGWPESLPPAIVDHGQGIDADLVSDVPYGQTDEDPFVELALGRFLAEDCASATLLACRGLTYNDFRDRSWQKRFATAEWEGVCRAGLEAVGLSFAGHHAGGAPIDDASPLTNVGFIVHASHAMWTVLGATYAWDQTTLLAPCLVESAGCSTASLDQDAAHRSVAARLLRNGALVFAGNSRRGIAQQELFRSELWNALLAGQALGEANRSAFNRLIVAVLDKDETRAGPYHYQLYNHAVYGDPALTFGASLRATDEPARVELRGQRATVHAPSRWTRFEYSPLAEWGCAFPKLYMWRGAGMTTEDWWFDGQKRNEEALYFTAEVRTRRHVSALEALDPPPAPLGWGGRHFVDEHADGSRSLYWRSRLIDFDMTSGAVRAQVEQLEFRLRSD